MSGLSFEEMEKQLAEYGILLVTPPLLELTPVIRDEAGDRGIAAVHVENGRLVFDVGRTL